MTNSEQIATFLDWLRNSEQQHNMAEEAALEESQKTQDILHKLELDKTSYSERAKLASALIDIRQARRTAKDTSAILDPVVKWKENNKDFIHSLEQLLGSVRKEEMLTEGRVYYPRTGVVEETIGYKE